MFDIDHDDLIDPNDDDVLAEIAAECAFREEATIKFMVDTWVKCGATEQEVEIRLFLFAHEQDMISMAQAEQLIYLWDGGSLH